MATGKNASLATGEQTIEQLQKRYHSLHTKKIQAETKLDEARKQLAALQQEARDKYGTDDVAQLRARLADMQRENEEKRRAYQSDLDRIEADLAAVEQKFAGAESSPTSGVGNK